MLGLERDDDRHGEAFECLESGARRNNIRRRAPYISLGTTGVYKSTSQASAGLSALPHLTIPGNGLPSSPKYSNPSFK